jgi:hypothetical protein
LQAYYASGGALRANGFAASSLRYSTFLSNRAIVRGTSSSSSYTEGAAVGLAYMGVTTLERLNFTDNL